MTTPRYPPCETLSPEARRFIAQSCNADWVPVDLSADGLVKLRAETSQIAAPGCEAVKQELGAFVSEEHVADVPVQWVSPKSVAGEEVILYLFGGGFVSGSADDELSITVRLSDYLGRRVCTPRYRLAPEHPFPAAYNDVMAVYRVLRESAEIIVVGESAGGNLALGLTLAATKSTDLAAPLAVALLSPWIDMTHSGDSNITLAGLDPTLSVTHFLGPAALAYAGGLALSSPQVSPLFAEFCTGFPPTVISTGTRDLLLSDSVRLAARLREHGTTVDLQVAEGLWHVYEWHSELPEAAQSVRSFANFLARFLKDSKLAGANAGDLRS